MEGIEVDTRTITEIGKLLLSGELETFLDELELLLRSLDGETELAKLEFSVPVKVKIDLTDLLSRITAIKNFVERTKSNNIFRFILELFGRQTGE